MPDQVRSKMIDYRINNGYLIEDMARKCATSETVISILERGGVTHPNIVWRVQREYKLTDEEANQLLPKNYRPGTPDYDPNKFVSRKDIGKRPSPGRKTLVGSYDEAYMGYIRDRSKVAF